MMARLIKILYFMTVFIPMLSSCLSACATKVNLEDLGGIGKAYFDSSVILQHAFDSYDTVMIPKNYSCVITKTIRINSNNYLLGINNVTSIIIINADNFKWDDIFNPAAFVNVGTDRSAKSGLFLRPDRNIKICNLSFKLDGELNENMQSILRFSSIVGLEIESCSFKVNSKSGKGHNAVIDLHSAYKDVLIRNCKFVIVTNNKKHGGGIWIQNTSPSLSENVEIKGCSFYANCKDEMVAIYTIDKGSLKNIKVQNNSFSDTRDKITNVSFLTVFSNVKDVLVRNNKFNVQSNYKNIDGIIRIGLSTDNGKQQCPNEVQILNNQFSGKLSKSYTIRGYSGTAVKLRSNITKGQDNKTLSTKSFIRLPSNLFGQDWQILKD